MRTLDGRIAIVTGGSSGLGKATLIKFASLGATVINWDINQERGEALVNELKTKGYTTYFFRLNTANYDDVNQAATNIIGK